MANEQIALSFNQGITNVPSDATCDDNELEESLGMVFEDGEHRVIQKPRLLADNVPITILAVHKTSVSTNYIGYDIDGNLRWGTVADGIFSEGKYKYELIPAEQISDWNVYPPTDMDKQPFIWMRHQYGTEWRYYKCYGGTNIRFYNDVSSEPHDNYEAGDTYFEESVQTGQWMGQYFNKYYGFAKPETTTDYLGHYDNAERLSLTIIGNTLVANTYNGIIYFLWHQDDDGFFRYKLLDAIPSLDIEFVLFGVSGHTSQVTADNIATLSYAVDRLFLQHLNSEAYENTILGFYAKNKENIAEKGYFCLPFFAVAAIEMYDGSYTRITSPVLLVPSIDDNSVIEYNSNTNNLYLKTTACSLYYKLKTSLSEYIDIVKGVTIFVTRGVEIYKTSNAPTRYQDDYPRTTNGIYAKGTGLTGSDLLQYSKLRTETDEDWGQWVYFGRPLDRRSNDDIQYDLYNNANLYKIYEADISYTNAWRMVRPLEGVVKNLTTQSQLNMVDYFTNTNLMAANIMTYNSRLILSDVRRSFFEGFHLFLPIVQSDMPPTYNGAKYSFFVTIQTSQGNKVVKHTVDNYKVMQGYYFFYPDTRATKVSIYKDGYLLTEKELTESLAFGGAWTLPQLATSSFQDENATDQSKPEPEYSELPTPEQLRNTLIVSEANNPFNFTATGYYTVGTGEILGISSLTQALSQGQFGQYPLIVFTTDGIWAMSVADTGYFSATHPMSRDICNNIKSIVQTDGAVFFSSDKGLMVVVGSEVRCVSEQLSGKSGNQFATFLKSAHIAYDYRDSLLWIFNGTSTVCWIYSIKSGAFAHYDFGTGNVETHVVNNYPDFLLQIGTSVMSLLQRVDINDDEEDYSGTIITRPMKFDNAMALKSIRQIKNVHYMEGQLTYRLFASNDLKNWRELNSLRGMPWKYYRLHFSFTGLKATDRFAGTVIVTQERRTNKLR